MNEVQIRQKLTELAEALNKVLRSCYRGTKADGVYASGAPLAQADPDDVFQELSLQVKYLIFDLEATRRENHYLRQILDSRQPPDDSRGETPGSA